MITIILILENLSSCGWILKKDSDYTCCGYWFEMAFPVSILSNDVPQYSVGLCNTANLRVHSHTLRNKGGHFTSRYRSCAAPKNMYRPPVYSESLPASFPAYRFWRGIIGCINWHQLFRIFYEARSWPSWHPRSNQRLWKASRSMFCHDYQYSIYISDHCRTIHSIHH